MKERPILFSAPMVRAILAGTKTQTRRAVKPQPRIVDGAPDWKSVRSPYGQPGDRLWVREAWRVGAWLHRDPGGRRPNAVAIDYQSDNFARREWLPCVDHDLFQRLVRQSIADAQRVGIKPFGADEYNWKAGNGPTRWRPSIHMPRWASRITLEVTGMRVERLQDISEQDCVAEGIQISSSARRSDACYGIYECLMPDGKTHFNNSAYDLYRVLWEQINGPGSWDANPWVWVVEFKRLKGGEA